MFWDNPDLQNTRWPPTPYWIHSWTQWAKKANEATFPTKFGLPGLLERFLLRSETILIKIQDDRPEMASDAIYLST